MFFYLSKIAWFVIQPLGLLFLIMLATALAALMNWRRGAIVMSSLGLFLLVAGGWTNAGQVLLNPLEERFVRPDPAPETVTGIIVLGGGMAGAVNLARGGHELEDAGDRFVEGAILARRYPQAKLVISGGSGALIVQGEGDADSAERLMTALGVEWARLVLENRSRNTEENARYSYDLLEPKEGETWLLVTSAFHMPRSMALFRQAGFAVTPWPVDYRTPGPAGLGMARRAPVDALDELTLGLREWIGLTAYYLTGRIPQLFPSP
ncbi:MAG: hypothetical protein CMJ42_04235 [Phyllobacteriaceae bacterium]|nr:hypothetical protein [Phyllobacteriaceae bacterium]MBA92938.1 hypothetical protein [Phyllobacteriaceae bacterium]